MSKKVKSTQNPVTKVYPSNSLYNWQAFNRKKLAIRKKIMLGIIEDSITLQDMFAAINTFVNYDNPGLDNIFKPEEKLNGLNQLFVVGMIEDEDDQNHLYDLIYNAIHESRITSKSVKDRAEIVERLLRTEILNCICLN